MKRPFFFLTPLSRRPPCPSLPPINPQGGPGAGGTGYGQFTELGPYDMNFNVRPTSWVYGANLLFLDSPVGAGFSYVDDPSLFTTNNTQIAADFVTFLKYLIPRFNLDTSNQPVFIFSESYGGKMTADIATAILAGMDAGDLKLNFRGVALGDSWIDGLAMTSSWGESLRINGLLDNYESNILQTQAVTPCAEAVARGDWASATNYWGQAESIISQYSCVDFYDIRQVDCGSSKPRRRMSEAALSLAPAGIDRDMLQMLYDNHVSRLQDPLSNFMNTNVRAMLDGLIPANVSWGGQSDAVFSALSGDFMKRVIGVVDNLLKDGRINVTVYEGTVDLICLTAGAEEWMQNLTWSGMPAFYNSTKIAVSPNSTSPTGAFYRSYGTLQMWYILQAGHMVPQDQGAMAFTMMMMLTGQM
jgi:serine carboxypeptidase 1